MVKTRRGLAVVAAFSIAAGAIAAVPAQADPAVGSISGHLTDAGAGASALVFLSNSDGTAFRYVHTDSTGFYQAADLPPGQYRVEFDLDWGGRQFAHQKFGWDTADVFTVTAGSETIVDDVVMPTGAIEGRFTAQDGTGLSGVSVLALGLRPVTTDPSGFWRIPRAFAQPDQIIQFYDYEHGYFQYAYGQLTQSRATPIAVVAGQTTVVNDVRLPTGSVRVFAKDGVTGEPIGAFSVNIFNRHAEGIAGEALLEDVTVGTHAVHLYADGYVPSSPTPQVTVTTGAQAEVTVILQPIAKIAVTVVDAATGAPLPGVCVAAVAGDFRPTDGCWETTDTEGRMTISWLAAGHYQLFADPVEAPGYGAQWVGPGGGTGKQHLAATVEVAAGQTATAPVIKMDRAGTLTGRVTTPSGAPARNGWAGVIPVVLGSGAIPVGSAAYDNDGRYVLDRLGPYDWQLFFYVFNEAPQFSGGLANRWLAKAIPVTAGGTSTYDYQLRAGVQLTVKVTGLLDKHPGIRVYNALTGDLIAYRQAYPADFEVTFPVIGPQFVKIAIEYGSGLTWYGGADKAHARWIWLPGSGSKTLELNFG